MDDASIDAFIYGRWHESIYPIIYPFIHPHIYAFIYQSIMDTSIN